jgi:hypothetical protein
VQPTIDGHEYIWWVSLCSTHPTAEKLKKAKKLKLKITGGEGFDPYGDVIVSTFTILKVKPKVKYKKGLLVKNEVKVTVLVPAGIRREALRCSWALAWA